MKKGFIVALICLITLLFATPVIYATSSADQTLLKPGRSGDAVCKLQQQLKDYGYYHDKLDGVYGQGTKLAVLNFQLDAGLDADGIVGSATLEALRNFQPGNIVANRGQGDTRKMQQLVLYAEQFIGVPYTWGGRSPNGFDCSGFVSYIFSHFGVQLPRMADEQFEVGVPISINSLLPGDVLFFTTYEPGASHVGIYIGGGQFIHASSGAAVVTITSLMKDYYRERYLGARRLLRGL